MEKTRIVEIKEVSEVYCDMCGQMISDGLPDGLGGINFWGLIAELRQGPFDLHIEVQQGWSSLAQLKIKPNYPIENTTTYVLCRKCAEKIEAFIEIEKRRWKHE